MEIAFQNKTNNQGELIYDVIISGAGPVGLFLACELALAKCSVLLLEKTANPNSPLKQMPFGMRGLSVPTIESLYRRGLFSELEIHKRLKNPHSSTIQGSRRQMGHFAGIPFYEDDIDSSRWKYRLPGAPETNLLSEMQELETILAHRATHLGAVIMRGFAIEHFTQTEDGVTVQSANHSFEGKWLVGCDGSRSIVRKKGGFEFEGTEPEFTGYTAQVAIANPEKLSPGRNITARGMYLQSQPGYLIIQDFDKGLFHGSGKPVSVEHLQEVLRRISATDVIITTVHHATTWTDRARQASSYRNGRVLLAGDAAHIHSPLGGQGLNLGLGDAMNLGWKLAATLQHSAPEGLLDSYHIERHPLGAQVLDWSRAQVALMYPNPHARALQSIFCDLLNTRDGATYIAGKTWGIFTHYDLGGDDPLTGYSVPNFEFDNGENIYGLMQDGKGLLLGFAGHDGLRNFAGSYGDQVNYISGKPKNNLGFSAVLVRPDGIVAWTAVGEPHYEGLKKAADRWFVFG